MKKFFVALIAALSLMLVLSSVDQVDVADAAAKTMYVNAKGDVKLRATAEKDGKHLGSIKNKSAIKVLSISKGWAYVETGKKKGYVYASALSNTNPNIPVITGGLLPKEGLLLTYAPGFSAYLSSDKKRVRDTYVVTKYDKAMILENVEDGDAIYYEENKKALQIAVAYTDWTLNVFDYPMKHGKHTTEHFVDMHYSESSKILVESTNKTVKVKAGTFDNVVILKTLSGYRYYLAKGIGLLKVADPKGKSLLELEIMN